MVGCAEEVRIHLAPVALVVMNQQRLSVHLKHAACHNARFPQLVDKTSVTLLFFHRHREACPEPGLVFQTADVSHLYLFVQGPAIGYDNQSVLRSVMGTSSLPYIGDVGHGETRPRGGTRQSELGAVWPAPGTVRWARNSEFQKARPELGRVASGEVKSRIT